MPKTIFFSWQLDTPSNNNKTFIWEAIQSACSVQEEQDSEICSRPQEGATGIPGAPNIIDTIFKRIRDSSVFIADLTFVGETAKGKKLSNPNVLIELGYAARCLGWERVILLMNEDFGSAKELPFDILQHRWPISFKVTDKTEVREKRKTELIDCIATAISDCDLYEHEKVKEMSASLDGLCLSLIANNFEHWPRFAMPTGSGSSKVTEMNYAIRYLVEIGAIHIPVYEGIPWYEWTYFGRKMVKYIHHQNPELFPVLNSSRYTKEKIVEILG